MNKIEQDKENLKVLFGNKYIGNEWFDLSDEDIKKIKDYFNETPSSVVF